jgi:ATP-dependent Clp protease ATP-binding subunit ClpX
MIEQVRVYSYVLSVGARRQFVACAYADRMPAGPWEAWLVFYALEPEPPRVGDRETTQQTLGDVGRWAATVTPVYLQGALERVLGRGTAPLWRHGVVGRDPVLYARVEMRRYRSDRGRMRTLGRRLLAGISHPPPRPIRVSVHEGGSSPVEKTERRPRSSRPCINVPPPSLIKEALDDYVVGQERAKKVLAVATANHYKRLRQQTGAVGPAPRKANVLLLGPTGSGKTLLVETLARLLEVPFTFADATRFTQAGYAGADVDEILADLLSAAGGDVALAECGIVCLDEIDKIARRQTSGRDVSGEGVQQALLKLVEGSLIPVPAARNRSGEARPASIDTRNVLFVCSGAFAGLESIIERRMTRGRIGFGRDTVSGAAEETAALWDVIPPDLVQYGMIPELVGRLPVVVVLEALGESALVDVLTKPKDALLKQYQALLRPDRVSLRFTEAALRATARKALALGMGVRGLRTVLESVMLDLMYEMPRSRRRRIVQVTDDVVELRAAPVVTFKT